MQLGLASICSITFSLINTTGKWNDTSFKGAKLIVYLGKSLASGDEYIKLGHFTVEDAVKNEGIINISASDNMADFDTRFKGIPFPCTIKQLLVVACFQAGVTLVEPELSGTDFVLSTLENVTSLTCREVVSLACELLGGFAIINSEGELEVRWFDTNRVNYTIPSHFITSCKPGNSQIATGVSGYFDGEELISGSPDALVHLTDDNIFLQNVSIEEKIALVQTIYDHRISQMQYDPGTVEAKGLCTLEPGDVIQFEYAGKTHKYIVSAIKLSDNLKMTITSAAPSPSSNASGGFSAQNRSSNSSSNLKTVYMFSHANVSLPVIRPFSASSELVSVSITKSEGHVPILMFSSSFTCTSEENEAAQVRFTMYAGTKAFHSFAQRCHRGGNVASISWPLADLPAGATRISVVAEVSSRQGDLPHITWNMGDTSLIVFGRGFNSTSTWNGLFMASETFKGIPVSTYSGVKERVARINGLPQVGLQVPRSSNAIVGVAKMVIGNFNSQQTKVSVRKITGSLTIE